MLVFLALAAAWFAYKKAKTTGRRPILWAIGAFFAFVAPQFILGFTAALITTVGVEFWDWREDSLYRYAMLINIVSLIGGFICLLAVYWYLDKKPVKANAGADVPPPPPPPTF